MKYLERVILLPVAAMLLAQPLAALAAEEAAPTPDFQEISKLITEHLAGESNADLNRQAVDGLLHELHGKVSLVSGKTAPSESDSGPALAKSAVYDSSTGYLRVAHVTPGLAKQIADAVKRLEGTNHLKGLVLDLRFAGGSDYDEAAATADLFISTEKPLLDWGKGFVQSKSKTDAITLPLAVLVNEETAAASEALAAVLRGDDRAILIGANTAGEATMSTDFPLKNGQELRIATSAVKLSSGEMLSTKGIKPDIQVAVNPENEKAYYADPYKEIPANLGLIASLVGDVNTNLLTTNALAHPQPLREAELIRERKLEPGVDLNELPMSTPPGSTEPEPAFVRDPVLGRALDLIKGIAVMNRTQTP